MIENMLKEDITVLEAGLKEDWETVDACGGISEIYFEQAPVHSPVNCDKVREASSLISELGTWPSDTDRGRSVKLTQYIDLSRKYLNTYPPDWQRFVRTASDLPLAKKTELLKKLEAEHGWKIDWKSKEIIDGPIRGYDPSLTPTNLTRMIKERK